MQKTVKIKKKIASVARPLLRVDIQVPKPELGNEEMAPPPEIEVLPRVVKPHLRVDIQVPKPELGNEEMAPPPEIEVLPSIVKPHSSGE